MAAQDRFHIEVSSDGEVVPRDVERAEERLTSLVDVVPNQVLHGQLRLSMSPPPFGAQPAKVEGALSVEGHLVRAQVSAATMHEAIDRFIDRLRSRLTDYTGRLEDRRHASQAPEPGQWRSTDIATNGAHFFDRPVEDREIVRRKSFASPSATPEEAVFDMESLDHDFFLFRNAESGEANVVYRRSDGSYEIIQPSPQAVGSSNAGGAPIRSSDQVPPSIPSADAVTALNIGNEPFLFFIDADDGEGTVVYRRYDGHYGMITLADA